VAETFAEENVDEKATIEQAALKKMRTLAKLDQPTQRRRLYSFLARRGYDADDINQVVTRFVGRPID